MIPKWIFQLMAEDRHRSVSARGEELIQEGIDEHRLRHGVALASPGYADYFSPDSQARQIKIKPPTQNDPRYQTIPYASGCEMQGN